MKESISQPPPGFGKGVSGWLEDIWPATQPGDTEWQRRKKLAVRGGQLALAVMVVAALGGTIAADFGQFSGWDLVVLALVGLAYLGWSLHGTHGAVRLLLWEKGAPPPRLGMPGTSARRFVYFGIQLGLAGLLYYLGDRGGATPLMWLVLLPPVAHSVILLPRSGIALVSLASLGILCGNVVRWHGWETAPMAVLEFSFAVLFTVVFTMLAVSSERARGDVQLLAGQLSQANHKLRQYAVQAEELAATRERNHLAREIHGSLGHYLTVVNVQLEAARTLGSQDPVRARQALEKAQTLTQEGLQEIRQSVAALRMSPLDNVTLPEALRLVVEESRASGLAAEMELRGRARPLSPQASLTLYRAGQEGLTNVRKHARASVARLILDFQIPDQVRLCVSDNGGGADQEKEPKGGFGLLGLRERAVLLQGAVRVETAPGAGFTLEVAIPG